MRVALVGAGAIAREHIKALRNVKGIEIAAIADHLSSLSEVMADEFCIPQHFSDLTEMLASVQPAVLHVTTPVASHFPIAAQALASGCHVLVEKPVTRSTAEFDQLRAIAESSAKLLIENQNYLHGGAVQALLAAVESGEFGDVRHVEVRACMDLTANGSPFADRAFPHPSLREPGGAISDFLPHFAYLCHAFTGPARSVWKRYREIPGSPVPYDEFAADVTGERATASVFFSASIQASLFELRVYCAQAVAEVDLLEPRLSCWRPASGTAGLAPLKASFREAKARIGAGLGGLRTRLRGQYPAMDGMRGLIQKLYASLATGGPPPMSLDDIAACVRLVEEFQPRDGSA